MPHSTRRSRVRLVLAAVLCGLAATPADAQEVPVVEHELDNGLTLLLVPRPGDPNVAAGWIARVGSVYERPGNTGLRHPLEQNMKWVSHQQ